MRLCPSVEGSGSPLITHRIGVDVCLARQGANFHKCHRCIYRGKPAGWEPENPPMAHIELRVPEEPARTGVKHVEIPRPEEVGGKSPVRAAAQG